MDPRRGGATRNLHPESVKKMRDAVERLFLGFCTKHGCRLLKQLGVDEVRAFRNSLFWQALRVDDQGAPGARSCASATSWAGCFESGPLRDGAPVRQLTDPAV